MKILTSPSIFHIIWLFGLLKKSGSEQKQKVLAFDRVKCNNNKNNLSFWLSQVGQLCQKRVILFFVIAGKIIFGVDRA